MGEEEGGGEWGRRGGGGGEARIGLSGKRGG